MLPHVRANQQRQLQENKIRRAAAAADAAAADRRAHYNGINRDNQIRNNQDRRNLENEAALQLQQLQNVTDRRKAQLAAQELADRNEERQRRAPRVGARDQNVLWKLRKCSLKLQHVWDEHTPMTEWSGVTFGETGGPAEGRVVTLVLAYHGSLGLSGDKPGSLLAELDALEYLDLENCGLTSVPAALGDLTSLRYLCLRRNPKLKRVPENLLRLRERNASVQLDADVKIGWVIVKLANFVLRRK
mmetsp:Transcript_34793/g.87257  ORF Transcript_34793/g.87257 Transcript_34793/m.87257 type:complete len:245 (+) Transcript_34793:107-841(+)|eukprot:CAMPEP_0181357822 /NCGR_PEP_ID=MMETSP1106-20121128/5173_1 /TAXON_ID=81844 /ORGANISM="Mantoniella antarctica, Strain SL-175" /LENGTH=244 /DNA_ID=CAMNT_0023470725 /DNA_START=274 /DNA_END=1008 /DNA_ORIENTATION=-